MERKLPSSGSGLSGRPEQHVIPEDREAEPPPLGQEEGCSVGKQQRQTTPDGAYLMAAKAASWKGGQKSSSGKQKKKHRKLI